jgi:hypothetical protein
VIAAEGTLRRLSREDLPAVAPWFLDPDTRRFLGGPDWPERMLAREGIVGETFRGATQYRASRSATHRPTSQAT